MEDKITVICYDRFVRYFLPPCPPRKPCFKNTLDGFPVSSNEKTKYDALPKALNDAGICPGFTFVAIHYHPDQTNTTRHAVDCGMYPKKQTPQLETSSRTSYPCVNWSWMELPIEWNPYSAEIDPFDDDWASDEPNHSLRRDSLKQILSSVESIFRYQHRMFLFMIILIDSDARIVRFDRSGIFATHKFSYKTSCEQILDFLWRYARLSSTERGHDPTVKRIDPASVLGQKMKEWGDNASADDPHDYIREFFKESLDERWPWWQVEVHTQPTQPARENKRAAASAIYRYLVGKPHFDRTDASGRGTRGYVALPVAANRQVAKDAKFVYLKDTWRIDRDDFTQEGVTLQRLNREEVKYVPTLVCHGDLLGQATQSPKYWRHYHWDADGCALTKYIHYRLVVKEVGKPLKHFGESSRNFVQALLCCLFAHKQAYEKAQIIHGDISAGNILLYNHASTNDWHGLLNDWELSRQLSGPRQPKRTGTWTFMSVHAAHSEDRRIVVQDELESFFYVLLYYAIRFVPSNLSPRHTTRFLHDYFDSYTTCYRGFRPWAKEHAMEHGMIDLKAYNGDKKNIALQFSWPAPEPPSPSKLESLAPCVPCSGQHEPTPSEHFSSPTSSELFGSELTPPLLSPPPKKRSTHPVDDIVTTLLSWFKAYYALVETRLHREFLESLEMTSDTDSTPPAEAFAAGTAKDEKDEEAVEKMITHAAIIRLIFQHLPLEKWPAQDRKAEYKGPSGGDVLPKDQTAAAPKAVASKKRPSEGGDASTRKRRKT